MRNEPIRVLQVVGRMDRGGIETMIMNLYRNIDRNKVQFDFLAHYGREAVYNDEIRAMGGHIYEMPALKDENHVYYWRIFSYIAALHKFFREHSYKIVHGHMTNTAAIYMPIARKYGATCLISHSHSSHGKAGLLGKVTNILQKPIRKNATDWFACSKAAAEWFYSKEDIASGKVHILANAVDAQKFRFSPGKRKEMRAELGVDGKIVIGCVARFRTEKNQVFLVDVLKKMAEMRDDVVVLFTGDGPEEEQVKQKMVEAGVQDKAIFLGMRTDIPDVMQAMDALAMPSIFEGLPVTGIEAQASGLRILASTGVTDEMNALGMVEYLSLEEPVSKWAEKLIGMAEMPRQDNFNQICEAGYDIHTTAPWLQNFYLEKENAH